MASSYSDLFSVLAKVFRYNILDEASSFVFEVLK